MKKLFFIIALFAAIVAVQAQSNSTIMTYVPGSANFVSYTGTAAKGDTGRYAASVITRVIDLRRMQGLGEYVVSIKVTQTSGDIAGHRLAFQGSGDGTTWTDLKSYAMTAATTTKLWMSTDTVSHVVLYPYLRVQYTPDSGTGVATLSNISVKIAEHK
jgi:hypothetical protein